MEKKQKNKQDIVLDISAEAIMSQPRDCFEQLNKYGTYEIQPTNDSDQDFPKIAQGLPKPKNRKVLDMD